MRILFWRTFYFFVNPFRRLYWFVVRPKTRGVKCVIFWQDKILLVRLAYAHKKWTIPGGGVKRHETPEQAAKRELREEVGINLSALNHCGSYQTVKEYKRDTVDCFYANVESPDFVLDDLEISEAGWFSLDDLPENRVPRVNKIIPFCKKLLHDQEN